MTSSTLANERRRGARTEVGGDLHAVDHLGAVSALNRVGLRHPRRVLGDRLEQRAGPQGVGFSACDPEAVLRLSGIHGAHANDVLRLREGERTEQRGVHNAQNGGGGCDAKAQRHDGRGRERRLCAERAQRVAEAQGARVDPPSDPGP